MDRLSYLENRSIYCIREAYYQFRKVGLLWSIGKDSTTLLYLIRKAFFGKIPFPVIHIDTGYKFQKIYEFRDRLVKEWGLDLIVARNEDAIKRGVGPENSKLECCNELKTLALKNFIKKEDYRALYLAIRRDEHGIRGKERVFSPRNDEFKWNYLDQPVELWDQYKNEINKKEHVRVHPVLEWREIDIWEYIQRENIPVIDLYFSKDNKRYRSIGCETCCRPVESTADSLDKIVHELKTTNTAERAGRAQDKESAYIMQKLRSLGYM